MPFGPRGPEPIAAILFIVGTWLGLIASLTGLGALAMRIAGLRMVAASDPVWSFWLGFSLLIAFLQIWHLGVRINGWTLVAPLALGAGGLLWNLGDLRRCWSAAPVIERIILTVTFAWLAIWLANRACRAPTFYDTGLYHLNAIRWAQEHPIVPGLVNLHYRLAFNNASLLYVAALNHGWWAGWALQISGGVLVLMLAVMVVQGLVRWIIGSDPATAALVRSLLIMPIVDVATGPLFSSPATDIPTIVLTLVAGLGCLALLDPRCDRNNRSLVFLSLSAVCAAAVCVKISALMFCACAGLLGLLAWWRAVDVPLRRRLGVTGLGAVLTVLLLGPWMARGVILSGYPLYPSTVGAAPVDWRAPEAAADAVRVVTRNWAKWADRPPKDPSSFEWLSTWWEIRILAPWYPWQALMPALAASAALLALLLRAWRAPGDLSRAGTAATLLLPTAAALVFWWYAAPDPRFGAQVIWLFTALIGAIAAMAWRLDRDLLRRAAVLVGCLLYGSLPLTDRLLWNPFDADLRLYAPPEAQLRKFTTASGLTIWTPSTGFQCWDAPLPCSPYPDARLRLRYLPHLSSGFVLDGEDRGPVE